MPTQSVHRIHHHQEHYPGQQQRNDGRGDNTAHYIHELVHPNSPLIQSHSFCQKDFALTGGGVGGSGGGGGSGGDSVLDGSGYGGQAE